MRFSLPSAVVAVVLAYIHSAAAATVAPRSSGWSPSNIKSFSLKSWGPMEKDDSGDVVFLDPTITSEDYIKNLKSKGKLVVCYTSAGTLEKFRADKSKLQGDTARNFKGFSGTEQWLDITQWESFKNVMADRIKEAAAKGCDAMELDNIDCFQNGCVKGYSEEELKKYQVEYVLWLVDQVKSEGMACGMKNAIPLFDSVASKMDFAINEQCQAYNECHHYEVFTSRGKVVFGVEYNNNGGKVCSEASANHMMTKYRNGGWHDC